MRKILFAIAVILASFSCREVRYYFGEYKIVSRGIDNSLADSVLVYGRVVSTLDTVSGLFLSRVWTKELSKETYTDATGYYSLKLPSGTFTIYCQEYAGSHEFTETVENLSLLPNEKVEITFYLGNKVE